MILTNSQYVVYFDKTVCCLSKYRYFMKRTCALVKSISEDDV